MKRSACILIVLLSVIFLVQSCEENSTTPDNTIKDLIPLKVGNYWKATSTRYNQDGNIDNIWNFEFYVIDDTLWENEKIYEIKTVFNGDDSSFFNMYWLNRKDGFYQFDYPEPSLEIKYPAKVGDTFFSIYDTMIVDKIDVKFTVPAGTFNCYRYSSENYYDNTIIKSFVYYSPGIGHISTENYQKDDTTEMYLSSKWELIEYKVK